MIEFILGILIGLLSTKVGGRFFNQPHIKEAINTKILRKKRVYTELF